VGSPSVRQITAVLGATLVVASAALISCKVQTDNSVNGDATVFGVAAPVGSNLFEQVNGIVQQNCATCHNAFPSYSQEQWIANGYVVAGDPTASLMFQKIRGAIPGGSGDMPQGGQLSASEISTIQNWIESINAPAPSPTPSSSSGGGGGGGLTAAQRTTAALAVIQTSCASCHGVTQTAISADYAGATVPAFAAFTTDAQFVVGGMVTEGQPSESWLYEALLTYGTINLMPEGGPALSAGSSATLNNWITNIGNP
jgi:uncharacterized membrane protein